MIAISPDISTYNDKLSSSDKSICDLLLHTIVDHLAATENKIRHWHPVWFIHGNPIVGYHKLKDSVRLLFWSGQSFDEDGLQSEGSFKAAEVRYTDVNQINSDDLKRCLHKAETIQRDYKNIVKRKGKLERL